MFEKLLEVVDGRLLVPLVVVAAGVALVKGVFSLTRSRSQDRRDFLDLSRGHDIQTDLWLTVAVRHVFGAYLPASLIRRLMYSPQPGRALLEVASAWDFLDVDDVSGELRWRRQWFHAARSRKIIARVLSTLYLVLASISLWLAYSCVTGAFHGITLWIAWAYVILSGFAAFGCLSYGDSLKDADKAARRWLGMP